MLLNRPKQSFTTILAILSILGIALGATYQFLGMEFIPLTPGNDLAMHVGLVENFMIALKNGQLFPIMQSPPDAKYSDLPVFLLLWFYAWHSFTSWNCAFSFQSKCLNAWNFLYASDWWNWHLL